MRYSFVILGQAHSKANSRRLVKFGDKIASVKSVEALAYERDALKQIPPAVRVRLEGAVVFTATMYYTSERPDLDESLLLDCLQDRYGKKLPDGTRPLIQAGVYRNDRQVRERHVYFRIDAKNPRAEITIEALLPQQVTLLDVDTFVSVPLPPTKRKRAVAELGPDPFCR